MSSHYEPDRILTIFTVFYKYLQILYFMVFTEFFYQIPKNLLLLTVKTSANKFRNCYVRTEHEGKIIKMYNSFTRLIIDFIIS